MESLNVINFCTGKVDFLQELEGHKQTYGYFTAAYGKLKVLWNLNSRSSHVNATIKEICGGSLKYPCQTRWNAEWDSMNDAYEKREKVRKTIH